MNYGLFKLSEQNYQVRGFDLANLTLIKGDTGWIVFDVLTAEETVRGGDGLCRRSTWANGRCRPWSTRTPTPTTSAASTAWWTRPMCAAGKVQIIAPRASWTTPSPRTSSPATP